MGARIDSASGGTVPGVGVGGVAGVAGVGGVAGGTGGTTGTGTAVMANVPGTTVTL